MSKERKITEGHIRPCTSEQVGLGEREKDGTEICGGYVGNKESKTMRSGVWR